jgi:hypothetical protein
MNPALSLSVILLSLAAAPSVAAAQTVAQRGFLEIQAIDYPQAAANDDTRVVGEALLRYEVSGKPLPWLRIWAGADARSDTHRQTGWNGIDWSDRTAKRPAIAIRRLDATLTRGPLTLDLGKQFVRWGKTDVLSPTDRFAPRDYLAVVDSEFLGVTAARLTAGLQSDTLDVIAARFTPSRMPLLKQRWAGLAPELQRLTLIDNGAEFPGRAQIGARWNHVASGLEFSLSAFRGNSHLPIVDAEVPTAVDTTSPPLTGLPLDANTVGPVRVPVTRMYPAMWMAGGDAAIPLSSVTIKGEAAFFGSSDSRADEYWLYVIQLERQKGEWVFVGGYSGEVVTKSRGGTSFAPDRGLSKAFLGRAGYTIDTNRSIAFEGAVRQNGDGSWLRFEYSQASGQHLRFTARGTWIRGDSSDFLGRYARNSHVTVGLRYSY